MRDQENTLPSAPHAHGLPSVGFFFCPAQGPRGIEEFQGFVWNQLSIGESGVPGDGMGSVLPK